MTRATLLTAAATAALTSAASASVVTTDNAYAEMSFEDLLSVELTSASRRTESIEDAAASVFVISRDDIARSPARNVPELLRMVPGVQVARIDHNNYKISIRGGSQLYTNKLLVMIDGRSVYTPVFGGVFWDQHDLILEDIERIEVVRGPGGTVWGANATNGVINIITRSAEDTKGLYVSAEYGTEERPRVGLRLGGGLSTGGAVRVSAQFARFEDISPNPVTLAPVTPFTPISDIGVPIDGPNGYDTAKLSFRLDQPLGAATTLTVDGGVQSADLGAAFGRNAGFLQAHLLGRVVRETARGVVTAQAFYDHSDRQTYQAGIRTDVMDLDLSHAFEAGRHSVVYGGGLRYWEDRSSKFFQDETQADYRASLFAQDEVSFAGDQVRLTLGTKLEYNSITGFEVQPSVRALWRLGERRTLWGAVSRNVRTPSRVDRSVQVDVVVDQGPVPVTLLGSPDVEAESSLTAEIGYRSRVTDRFSLEGAVFATRYEDLIEEVTDPLASPPVFPIFVNRLRNGGEGQSVGVEVAANLNPLDGLTAQLAYGYVDLDVDQGGALTVPLRTAPAVLFSERGTAQHLVSLRTSADLPWDLTASLWARYTSEPVAKDVGDHIDLDARLTWAPEGPLRASVAGENLLDGDEGYLEAASFVNTLTELSPTEPRVTARLELDF